MKVSKLRDWLVDKPGDADVHVMIELDGIRPMQIEVPANEVAFSRGRGDVEDYVIIMHEAWGPETHALFDVMPKGSCDTSTSDSSGGGDCGGGE